MILLSGRILNSDKLLDFWEILSRVSRPWDPVPSSPLGNLASILHSPKYRKNAIDISTHKFCFSPSEPLLRLLNPLWLKTVNYGILRIFPDCWFAHVIHLRRLELFPNETGTCRHILHSENIARKTWNKNLVLSCGFSISLKHPIHVI